MGDRDQLLTEESDQKGHARKGIHKETPMFSPLFQEIPEETIGYLRASKPLLPENSGKTRKTVVSRAR